VCSVFFQAEDGIRDFHVTGVQTCALPISETDTTLIMIPVEHMSLWLGKYKSWQNFILQSYHERMSELLEAIDTIAFLKMDERILKYLRDKAMVNHSEEISATHQQIANDLHTSRVVVSRILKALENNRSEERRV